MDLSIKWLPNVCGCEIMQDRHEPDLYYQFTHKCELHQNMTDAEARADIIALCIAFTESENA